MAILEAHREHVLEELNEVQTHLAAINRKIDHYKKIGERMKTTTWGSQGLDRERRGSRRHGHERLLRRP